MVKGEAECEFLTDGESIIFEDDRDLADGTDAEDGDFGIVDHWRKRINTEAPEAGESEDGAFGFGHREATAASAGDAVGGVCGELGEGFQADIAEHGDDESFGGIDGESEVNVGWVGEE